jgi:hypothetical protein
MTEPSLKNQKSVLTKDLGSHTVWIYEDFVIVKPKSNKHMIIISCPDCSIEPDKHFETSIYIGNHAQILVNGEHKGTIHMCLQNGEYPTQLSFDESEGKFDQKSTYELIEQKVPK